MYATNYFETKILNVFRGVTYNAPANVYLGLLLNNPGETGGGTELSYDGYARQSITFSEPALDTSLGEYGIQNTNAATYAAAPTAAGTVTHVAVYDSQSGGNMLLYGQLTNSIIIDAGEAPAIIAGEIKFLTSGNMTNAYRTKMLNILRGVSITGINPYLALFYGSNEVVATNYGRKLITFGAPVESDGGTAYISNTEAVVFNQASTNWGYYDTLAIVDASSGGVVAFSKSRASARYINRLKRVQIPVGDLKVGLN